MKILITTEHPNSNDAQTLKLVSDRVTLALAEVRDQIAFTEVHLSNNQEATVGRQDLHCFIEARFRGRQPMLVAHQAASVDSAVAGALGSLLRVIECALARSRSQASYV